jgi:hypothetical protein
MREPAMADDRIQEKTTSPTEIAEGMPPLPQTSHERPAAEDTPSILKKEEEATAQQVFLAWEKLRIAYNVSLLFVVVVRISFGADMPHLLLKAIGANVLYCIGPVAEGYLVCLGVPRLPFRWLLFIFGTVVATLITVFIR